MPKIPKSSFDVHNALNKTQCITSRNENFVQYNNKAKVLLYFVVK
jgi:hypothetical protein